MTFFFIIFHFLFKKRLSGEGFSSPENHFPYYSGIRQYLGFGIKFLKLVGLIYL
jgi:hypothetical protein